MIGFAVVNPGVRFANLFNVQESVSNGKYPYIVFSSVQNFICLIQKSRRAFALPLFMHLYLISVTYTARATGASTSVPLLVYSPPAGRDRPSPVI